MYILRRGLSVRFHRASNLQALIPPVPRRFLSTASPWHIPHPRDRRGRLLFFTSALSGSVLFGLWADAKSCPDPPFKFVDSQDAANTTTTHAPDLIPLLRSYFVYGLLSIPVFVDHTPALLDQLLRIPMVGYMIGIVVRHTFFAHFVAGETIQHTLPVLQRLRAENKAVLLVYSAEVDESEAAGLNAPVRSLGASSAARPLHKRIMEETIHSIDVAGDFEDSIAQGSTPLERKTSVAVKLTALLPRADALRNLSLYLTRTKRSLAEPIPFPGTPSSADLACLQGSTPGRELSPLTAENISDLTELHNDLKKICTRASQRGVRVIIDAEHSWYQPAIDAYGHALMEEFNKFPENLGLISRWFSAPNPSTRGIILQPLVYVTYQAYLRRTPTHLAQSLVDSRRKGYALGVKLVRGAYHPHEIAAHNNSSLHSPSISPDSAPPVYLNKSDTDACYHGCTTLLVRAITEDVASSPDASICPPRLGVLFATHNWLSSNLVLEELIKNGLVRNRGLGEKGPIIIPPEVAERVAFAQLYGMADSLTNHLAWRSGSTMPCVIKYVPYGALVEVLPYLARRAIENRTVLGDGGATRERKEAAKMIWDKLFGGFTSRL